MKRDFIIAAVVLTVVVNSFGEELADLQRNVDDFSTKLSASLPFNASMGLNWSDAYIGKFLGVPPHFGVGVSGGVTTLNSAAFNDLLDDFGLSLPIGQMLLPAYVVEGRLGGFFLPFDVGVKFGALPQVDFGERLKIDYLLAGVDVRFAVMEGGVVLPKISVGVGFNFLKSALAAPLGNGVSFNVGGKTLALTQPEAAFSWETKSIDVKAQISKSLAIITPYAGLGASYAWSNAGYSVESRLQYDGSEVSDDDVVEIKNKLADAGVPDLDRLSANGFSSIIGSEGWAFRAFAGFSLNVFIVKFDLTGMYNFMDSNYGATLGVRLQI
ncbi:MAG: hypothetical protein LBE74_02335 [Treponema sp.]|jgi:hypothetical protein|nr:hypothetical protein [Treponema sp.]